MHTSIDLSKIIHPLDKAEFLKSYLYRQPIVFTRDQPEYFADLLSTEDLRRYFERNDLNYPNIGVVKQGHIFKAPDYTYEVNVAGNPANVIDSRKVFGHFQEGATVYFSGMEYSIDSLRAFAHGLVSELQAPLGLTGFYTPANSQGFKKHFDDVDVFVMQLFGSKVWRVYGCPIPFPVVTADIEVPPDDLRFEIELHPGDSMYIPRGFVHEAAAANETSFHISASVSAFKWVDVIRHVLSQAKEVAAIRSPFLFKEISKETVRPIVEHLLNSLLDQVSFDDIYDHCQAQVDKHLLITNNDYLDEIMETIQ